MSEKIYGEFVVGSTPRPTINVGHILGGHAVCDKAGKPIGFVFQHKEMPDTEEIHLEFGDAMFLLSLLKSIQLDHKIPFPDDPRG